MPDEFSICSFAGTFVSQSTDPPLTTVDQYGQEVEVKATELLINRVIHGEKAKATNQIIRTKLLVKGTKKYKILILMKKTRFKFLETMEY